MMGSKKRIGLTDVLWIAGILLIAAAVVLTVAAEIHKSTASKDAGELVSRIRENIPAVRDGGPDDRVNTEMPLMTIGNKDIAGIIELPRYGKELPIGAGQSSKQVSDHPCVYSGSMYDGSLVVVGSDAKGQFDFMELITEGDVVYITDMTGVRYKYKVTYIVVTSEFTEDTPSSREADLVLFAKSTYGLDYTVVWCSLG